jgi:hypothetical protein
LRSNFRLLHRSFLVPEESRNHGVLSMFRVPIEAFEFYPNTSWIGDGWVWDLFASRMDKALF